MNLRVTFEVCMSSSRVSLHKTHPFTAMHSLHTVYYAIGGKKGFGFHLRLMDLHRAESKRPLSAVANCVFSHTVCCINMNCEI